MQRKPIEMKVLQGTYQRCRDAKTLDLVQDLTTLPAAPDYLSGSGLSFYKTQGAGLIKEGRLTGCNLPLFLDACFYVQQQDLYKKRILKARNLDDHKTYKKFLDDTNKNLRLCLVEFGLTPVSASRVPKKVEKEKESKFQNFLKQGS
jgi:phage terminase small subunit